MVADSEIAFRLRGIPARFEKREVTAAIAQIPDFSRDISVEIHSLACDPVRKDKQVGTVTFSRIPTSLQGRREMSFTSSPGPGGTQLTIDTHFEGFTPLHQSLEKKCEVDIIAVCGLNGHAFGSYKQKDGVYMWLRDGLGNDLPNARILTYGYDTRAPSIQNIYDIANTFRNFLRSLRSPKEVGFRRYLILLGHSLGGVMVKAALTQMIGSHDETEKSIFELLRGILFFGVPSQGLRIQSLIPMREESAWHALLYSLSDENSPTMLELGKRFAQAKRFIQHCKYYYFYETKKSPTAILVDGRWKMEGPLDVLVSTYSATEGKCRDDAGHFAIAVNRTHSELVKFNGNFDEIYNLAVKSLIDIRSYAEEIGDSHYTPNDVDLKCLQSLSYLEQDWREQQDEIKATEGTCSWILEHGRFHSWMNETLSLLWILGPPGAGKSTLMKFIVENKRAHGRKKDTIAAFFVHGRGSEMQKSPLGLYRSLIHQILPTNPQAWIDLTSTYKARVKSRGPHGRSWVWTEGELRDFFISMLRAATHSRPLTIFIDALDEMGEERAVKLISDFQKVIQNSTSAFQELRVCFSCRYYPILLEDCTSAIAVQSENTPDIDTFIDSHSALCSMDAAQRKLIGGIIRDRANGIFQWVSLVLGYVASLRRKRKPDSALLARIQHVPTDLQGLYKSLILDGDDLDRQQTLKLFQWVLFTFRPITDSELRDALAADKDMTAQSFLELKSSEDFYRIEDMAIVVRHVSKGLAEVTKTRTVQLIHQSVSDWLHAEGLSILQSPLSGHVAGTAHFQISRSCIKYLLFRDIQGTTVNETEHLARYSSGTNLVEYAHCFWAIHMSEAEKHAISQNDLLELLPWRTHNAYLPPSFQPQGKYKIFQASHLDGYLNNPTFRTICESWDAIIKSQWNNVCWYGQFIPWKLVHFLAFVGVPSVLKEIHRQLPTIYDMGTGDGAEILLQAFFGLNEEAIQEVLNALKPQCLHQENFRISPLYLATMMDRDDLVRDLLDLGAEVDLVYNFPGGEITTAIYAATIHQKKKALGALVAGGAIVDTPYHYDADLNGGSPLHLAAVEGWSESIGIMLQTDLDPQTSNHRFGYRRQVDPLDYDGRTPLWCASNKGHIEVMQLLLSHGADPTAYDSRGEDCLEAYWSTCHLGNWVDFLLEWTDETGYTILMKRIANSDLKSLSDDFPALLLEVARSGLHDLNHQAKDGNTLLSLAASHRLKQIIQILLRPRFHVDPNIKDNRGKTALTKAAECGWEEGISLLLKSEPSA